jgi:hypothetical protein
MKFLRKLVIGSLFAIVLIETRHHVATAQGEPPRPAAIARPILPRESRIYKIRRKIALRAERLIQPLKARVARGDRPRLRPVNP